MCNNVLLVEIFKIEQFITKYRIQEAELNDNSKAVNNATRPSGDQLSFCARASKPSEIF